MRILCQNTFSVDVKKSGLQDHLNKMHSYKKDKILAYFQYVDGLCVSYNISLLIAQTGKPHTIGEELILPIPNKRSNKYFFIFD